MNASITVIIPVYNAKKYIEHTVRSVLDQPYQNIQLVLVDDGSRDGSGEICDQLGNNNSRVHVIHQENGGVAKARNTGIDFVLDHPNLADDHAYLAFLDADDLWKSNVNLSIKDHEDADLIAFSSAVSNEKANRFRIINRFENKILCTDGAYTSWVNDGTFAAFFYRIGFVRQKRLHFLEGVRRNEDVIFWRQATFSAKKMVFSSEILYIYRRNELSETHSSSIDHVTSLGIPKAWERAIEWIYTLPGATDTQKVRWTEVCTKTIGATLLESARILAENGLSVDEIRSTVVDSPFYEHLTSLKAEWLAEWQKNDLIEIQNDLDLFVNRHGKRGKRTKRLLKIRENWLVRKMINFRKYPLTEL